MCYRMLISNGQKYIIAFRMMVLPLQAFAVKFSFESKWTLFFFVFKAL